MNDKTIMDIGKSFFWISFVLGNICLFGYLITKIEYFVEGGLLVVGWGFIINLAVVLLLIIYGIFNKSKLDVCLKSVGIILLNIPIAIIYIVIGMSIVTI
ncbi:hypothetical protein ABEG63_14635 [Chryseobacterium sp. C39-AII1]|uniref:hypothetical protein n=1 Tax=Chryseobacterium sp. C39-AII1 TaxID=3080332 RepID=UPI003209E407